MNKLVFDDALRPKIAWQNETGHLDDGLRTYAMAMFRHDAPERPKKEEDRA